MYADAGFRAVYRNFCVFPLTDALRNAVKDFPGYEAAEAVLTYGYYDREAGITLEILACAIGGDKGWRFADGNDGIRSFIRIETVEEEDFSVLRDPDEALFQRYAKKLEMLKTYDVSDAIEKGFVIVWLLLILVLVFTLSVFGAEGPGCMLVWDITLWGNC